jgi:hypothetical protein
MPDMDSITDETGIDIEVVLPEVPEVVAGMKEGGEEIEVGEFTATLPYKLATGHRALLGEGGGAGVGLAGEREVIFCGVELTGSVFSAGLGLGGTG